MRTVAAYWYRREVNFGDLLTPWLLDKHGIDARWTHPNQAQFFGCGSILQQLPRRYRGTIWGAGLIEPGRLDLSTARVLALRGPLTGTADVYADPGLLVSLYVPRPDVEHRVGVVSHYIDPLPHDGYRIDVQAHPAQVAGEIARCETIISSSLHGLIVADSLGIPNMWVYSPKVVGNGFKFADYAASFDQPIAPDVWRLAPQDQVAEKQTALLEGLTEWCG